MTLWGWIFMVVSVGATTGAFIWCICRVLRPQDRTDRLHGVLDTEREIEERDR